MSRLTDADLLTNKLTELCDINCPYTPKEREVMCSACLLGAALEVVEDAPTAEPERKKGRWIPVDSFSAFGGDEETWMAHGNPVAFHYCSECKVQAHVNEFGEELLTSFCPHCGAEMEPQL